MLRNDGPGPGQRGRGPARIRALILSGTALAAAFALAGCSPLGATANTSDATPAAATATTGSGGNSSDPGCRSALHAVSTYGPSTVKLLADGRESIAKAAVQLLVDGLDGAANAANSPQVKQDIQTLATAYVDYFNLTTDAVAIPLSALLKATANLEFICG